MYSAYVRKNLVLLVKTPSWNVIVLRVSNYICRIDHSKYYLAGPGHRISKAIPSLLLTVLPDGYEWPQLEDSVLKCLILSNMVIQVGRREELRENKMYGASKTVHLTDVL